jgi:hypothetical protein
MRMILIFFTFGLLTVLSCTGFALNCENLKTSQTNSKIRAFMHQKSLIKDGEEMTFPDLGIQVRWELSKLLPEGANCLAVMSLCSKAGDEKNCDQAIEVVALKASGQSSYSIETFETIVVTPSVLVARIGSHPNSNAMDQSYYYAKLTGADAIAANKSWKTHTPYYGFFGVAIRGQKADFDPTPGRDWQIKNAKFDLHRGLTAEILDIQAFQLDGLDGSGADGYWHGCQQPNNTVGECQVAPWGQAFILEILPGN